MGVVACAANLATFLENVCFSVHDNSFKTFLSLDFHTFLWYLNRLYEGRKDFCNKFFFETPKVVQCALNWLYYCCILTSLATQK